MNKRFRASYTIAIVFAALALLAVYGYKWANDFLLGREKFAPLIPADVNIVGLDTSAGYHIVVENATAKLVQGSGGASFGGPNMDDKGSADNDAVKKFIPIKDMLLGLSGDLKHLSYFVQRMNDIKDDDLPPGAPVWRFEDIQKALAGDQTLRPKLVHDLNMQLDGTPLSVVSKSALYNGIVVDTPVQMQIGTAPNRKSVEARVHQPFRPMFLTGIENRLANKFATDEMIATEYAAAAKGLANGTNTKQNLAQALEELGKSAPNLAEIPQRILNSIQIVINEHQITNARSTAQETPKGTIYALVISLNDEGRKRLWQFSRNKVGDQLLVTVNGVAIAAPRVEHAISSGEVEVNGLEDESLVKDAVTTINERATSTK